MDKNYKSAVEIPFSEPYGAMGLFTELYKDHIATALPPLPRRPKPEHAALLYRYMAEGITVVMRDKAQYAGGFVGFAQGMWCVSPVPEQAFTMGLDAEITHATLSGQPVSVAIEEE